MQTGYFCNAAAQENEMPCIGSHAAKQRGPVADGLPSYVALPADASYGNAHALGLGYNPFKVLSDPRTRNMSDEDAQAVVAFLRSQPPTGTPTPENQFNLLGALFMNVRDFRSSHSPAGHVSAPPAGTAEYGHYMVNIIGCQNCHGDDLAGRVYSGVGPPAGPNLTKLVPQWTEEQFLHFFNTGIIPGGGQVPLVTFADGSKLPAMPWPLVRASATDDELKAMFSFLHSLQPIDGPTK